MAVTVWLCALAVVPTTEVGSPGPAPSPAEQRLTRMLDSGRCWNGGGEHPFPHHAFFLTPSTGLHYGPSGPAFAIVFGPDGRMHSGDEAAGDVFAFCR